MVNREKKYFSYIAPVDNGYESVPKMWSKESFHDSHVLYAGYFCIVCTLLFIALVGQHWAKDIAKLSVPQAIVPITLGLAVSFLISISGGYDRPDSTDNTSASSAVLNFHASLIQLDSSTFFLALLPPIIFNSGYHLKRRLLYDNFDAIIALALIGTTISLFFVAASLGWLQNQGAILFETPLADMELVAFGALISSTDPVSALAVFASLNVDPDLYHIILGEALLNDAVAVVIFKSASKYIQTDIPSLHSVAGDIFIDFLMTLTCSVTLGYGCGLFFAWLMKRCSTMAEKHSLVSVSLVLLFAWLPFFLAEALQLTGIVAILFTGIAARRYVMKNLGPVAALRSSFVSSMIAHGSETLTFLLLGMSIFSQDYASVQWSFVLWVLLATTLARAVHVYPLLALVNLYRWWRARHSRREREQQGYRDVARQEQDWPVPTKTGGRTPATAAAGTGTGNATGEVAVAGQEEEEGEEEDGDEEAGKHNNRIVSAQQRQQQHQQQLQHSGQRGQAPSSERNAHNSADRRRGSGGGYRHLDSTASASASASASTASRPAVSRRIVSVKTMHVIFVSGLRGAVSFSCSMLFDNSRDHRSVFLCTTSLIILITLFLQGSLVESAIRWLQLPIGVKAPEESGHHRSPAEWDVEERFLYPLLLRDWSSAFPGPPVAAPVPASLPLPLPAASGSVKRTATDGSGGDNKPPHLSLPLALNTQHMHAHQQQQQQQQQAGGSSGHAYPKPFSPQGRSTVQGQGQGLDEPMTSISISSGGGSINHEEAGAGADAALYRSPWHRHRTAGFFHFSSSSKQPQGHRQGQQRQQQVIMRSNSSTFPARPAGGGDRGTGAGAGTGRGRGRVAYDSDSQLAAEEVAGEGEEVEAFSSEWHRLRSMHSSSGNNNNNDNGNGAGGGGGGGGGYSRASSESENASKSLVTSPSPYPSPSPSPSPYPSPFLSPSQSTAVRRPRDGKLSNLRSSELDSAHRRQSGAGAGAGSFLRSTYDHDRNYQFNTAQFPIQQQQQQHSSPVQLRAWKEEARHAPHTHTHTKGRDRDKGSGAVYGRSEAEEEEEEEEFYTPNSRGSFDGSFNKI